jgi:hypothetical protein
VKDSPQVVVVEADGILRVTAKGTYNAVAHLNSTTELIYQKVTESEIRLLLLDFRESHFELPLAEAFNVVRRYELSMPAFRDVTAACVFNRASKEFTDYWQQLGNQRGYTIGVFPGIPEAERWIREKVAL